jgi:hypothetical protein
VAFAGRVSSGLAKWLSYIDPPTTITNGGTVMKAWNALPILLSLVAALPAWGQSGESIKIHVTYEFYGVRVRPEPGNVNTHADFTMTLSGTNEIAVTSTASDGSNSRTMSGKSTFGTIQSTGDTTGAFHIAGPHRLVGTSENPQSRGSASLVVTRKTCSYKIVQQLKPGSKEYKLFSLTLNAWAYYSQVRYSNFTCTIQ